MKMRGKVPEPSPPYLLKRIFSIKFNVMHMDPFGRNLLNSYPKLKDMDRFPVLDNHMHLDTGGLKEKVVSDFHRAGGTHIVLVHKPYHHCPILKKDDFRSSFEITLDLAERVRKKTPVEVMVALGPYPVNLLHLEKKYDISMGIEIMMKGMDIAAEMVQENLAVAMGEIGRPHFPIPDDIMDASNEILRYGLSLARDADCPVHLHTEGGGEELYSELAAMATESGLPLHKVIKHFSGPMILPGENHGLFPSVLASRTNITNAALKGNRFMMETDYIDDMKRPGAVMVPRSVPKRTFEMIEKGRLREEDVFKIHKEWPEKIYGVDVED